MDRMSYAPRPEDLDPLDTKQKLSCLFACMVLVCILCVLFAPKANAASRGYLCSGPSNVPVKGGYTVGRGTIRCVERSCSYVRKHRPWCPARNPMQIISMTFGKRKAKAAIEVSWCESKFYVFAGGRGAYQGPYQVSGLWRRKYARYWGSSMWERVKHAQVVQRNHGWGPWECKPR